MCSLRLLSASSNCLIAIEQLGGERTTGWEWRKRIRLGDETHDGEAGSYGSGGHQREEMDMA